MMGEDKVNRLSTREPLVHIMLSLHELKKNHSQEKIQSES